MDTIDLQTITQAEKGKAEKYWFENEHIGLNRTLFHRVYIPLSPFNSGLDDDAQPVKTAIVMEWLNLNLSFPTPVLSGSGKTVRPTAVSRAPLSPVFPSSRVNLLFISKTFPKICQANFRAGS